VAAGKRLVTAASGLWNSLSQRECDLKAYLTVGWLTLLAVIAPATCIIAQTPKAPAPRDAGEVKAVLAKASKGEQQGHLNIVLLADVKDHGENEHDYPLWQKRWALLLGGRGSGSAEMQVNLFGRAAGDLNEVGAGAGDVNVTSAWQWPSDEQFKTADLIVAYCYLKWSPERLKQVEGYLSRGGGFVVIHPASWTQPGPSAEVARLLGVGGYKLYRHGDVEMKIADAKQPICLGLPATIGFLDETYFPPTPQVDIEVAATSVEKEDPNGSKITPQAMFWTHKYGKGRVFGCVLGHYMWTFDDPYFRILVLRGMAWAAGDSPYRFDSVVLRGARVSDGRK